MYMTLWMGWLGAGAQAEPAPESESESEEVTPPQETQATEVTPAPATPPDPEEGEPMPPEYPDYKPGERSSPDDIDPERVDELPVREEHNLSVLIEDFSSTEGFAMVAIHDRPEAFPGRPMEAAQRYRLPIQQDGTVLVSVLAEPGEYALAVFHDVNANHELDQWFGLLPSEDFMTSGGGGFLGPPSFEEASFTLTTELLQLTLSMN